MQRLLKNKNILINHVIQIDVNENLLLERIKKRASDNQNIRDDDNSKILENRIVVYNEQTMPVLRHYDDLNMLKKVNGMLSVEAVSQEILNILENH